MPSLHCVFVWALNAGSETHERKKSIRKEKSCSSGYPSQINKFFLPPQLILVLHHKFKKTEKYQAPIFVRIFITYPLDFQIP